MTDRKLLELAAKAAGYEYRISDLGNFQVRGGGMWASWNPLVADGDALMLAHALKFTVDFETGSIWGAGELDETRLARTSDAYPCIRRAIVFAAALVGKAMQ